jgi:hypothetical protein
MSTSDPEPPVSKPIPIPSFRPTQVFRRDRKTAVQNEGYESAAAARRQAPQKRPET